MKFGISTWVWLSPLTIDGLAKVVPQIEKFGYDSIELGMDYQESLDLARVGEMIRDHNLSVSVCAALGHDCDLIHPDSKLRDNGLRFIKEIIDRARILGASVVGGPFYASAGRLWWSNSEAHEAEMSLLVGQLQLLSRYAHERGVTLCIEPLNRYETSFLNTASDTAGLVDRVGHPACKALLDTFHMSIEETDMRDALRTVGDRMGHFHVASSLRGAPGEGMIAWNDVAEGLREIGYDGSVVIESFTPYVPGIASATSSWRPLAPTQDILAETGLANLKAIFG
jgi:D-psicose/D-tagatose/L-ribulose 3-epimerase